MKAGRKRIDQNWTKEMMQGGIQDTRLKIKYLNYKNEEKYIYGFGREAWCRLF
jgi:hypothetical protein